MFRKTAHGYKHIAWMESGGEGTYCRADHSQLFCRDQRVIPYYR